MDELRKIDLNLLLTLHALLSERHVTRAALRLHRSQPAVSHSLALLRAHFNDPLLIRKNGQTTLSARALGLLPPLELALSDLNRLMGTPEFDPATACRRFRIAMSDYAAQIILPRLVARLRHAAPGFDLAVSQASREMMLAQLEDGELDLAFGVFPQAPASICQQALFDERFICLADPAFLPPNRTLTLTQWLERPHLKLAMQPDAVDEIGKALAAAGLQRRVCVALPHWTAAVNLLPGTDMVLTVASRSVSALQQPHALCRFEPPLPLPDFRYTLAWHPRKEPDPAHRWLRQAVLDCNDPLPR